MWPLMRELDPAAGDDERAHRLGAGLQDAVVGVLVDPTGERGGLDLGGDRGGGGGEPHGADPGQGGGDLQVGGLEQGADQVEVAEGPVGAVQLAGLGAQVAGEGAVHGAVALLGLELVPDLDGDGAAGAWRPGPSRAGRRPGRGRTSAPTGRGRRRTTRPRTAGRPRRPGATRGRGGAGRPRSSIASLRSRPTTRPRPPIRSAAVRATTPVPQATSSTAWPGATPAASTRCGAHSAKSAGTNCDSYTSAASTESWNVSTESVIACLLGRDRRRATIPRAAGAEHRAAALFGRRPGLHTCAP